MPSRRCSPADVTALILAGGKATRLGGVDKRELVVEGRTIFERQCEVLAPRAAEILVSSAREVPGFRTVIDAVPGAGPLGGIAAGLAAAATPWLLVVAGDMPYVSGAVIDLMMGAAGENAGERVQEGQGPPRRAGVYDAGERVQEGQGPPRRAGVYNVDAVGIRIGELPEPLFCLLRVAAARPALAARLAGARLKASRLLTDGDLRVAWVMEAAVREVDPTLRSLINVNEPADLRTLPVGA